MILPLAPVHAAATVRLVPSAYAKPPVLSAIADTEQEEALIAQLEGLTSGRLRAEREGLADLHPRELTYRIWGQSLINAAFSYAREEGNRFNDKRRGAWYCAFEDLTALEEVIFHRTRELDRIAVYEDRAVYQSLLASFVGDFHDARGLDPPPDFLGADPAIAYPSGQVLASALREQGSLGIVYPSARRARHDCLAAFSPHLVQNLRYGGRWELVWEGRRTPRVSGL
ncbi:MAG: RES family NAD+ phosphorylase [Pseudomonadota bacterium]